jgi:glycosyltransferase involved in cell wall biosynthesis
VTAPRVSVCIPSYNSAQFLGETIESALAQEYGDYELVVCDNASTDGTRELVARYKDPRLDYRRFERMVGQAANWNRCLDLARGTYVVLLHSDDLLEPRFLARAVAFLETQPSAGLVHCAVRHIETDGTPREIQRLYPEDHLSTSEELLRQLLFEGCVVNPAGVMVRRSVYDAVGRFTEEIVWGVDWHMWMRIALHGATAYLAEPLSRYRQHRLSGTSGVMASARNGADERWAVTDLFRRIPAEREDLQALRRLAYRQAAHRTWCFAEEMCRTGAMKAARIGVRNAVRTFPMLVREPRVLILFLATFVGYRWFEAAQRFKARVTGRGSSSTSAKTR